MPISEGAEQMNVILLSGLRQTPSKEKTPIAAWLRGF